MRQITQEKIKSSIANHQLPDSYANDVATFMLPVANRLFTKQQDKPLIVGIQGSQGSGKSTSAVFLKLLLEFEFDLKVATVSIDDFYLSNKERQALAKNIHPLLKTRGVPGTHHTDLITQQFNNFRSKDKLTLPQFDKATDNPKPKSEWLSIDHQPDVLIFEGWCVGLTAQQKEHLTPAINQLEKNEDANGEWRAFVNKKLSQEYAYIFSQLDTLIVLQAPSFDCVFEWRQLQEQKLISKLEAQGKNTTLTLTPEKVKRFIQHYQRLTEHGLESLSKQANFILELNANHKITSLKIPPLSEELE